MEKPNYKLRLKDFIPVSGLLKYMQRNPEDIISYIPTKEKVASDNRELILSAYNSVLITAALASGVLGLIGKLSE